MGGMITSALLKANTIKQNVAEQQNDQDRNFSTIKSPNPDNAEALDMSSTVAKHVNADFALATESNGDRFAISAKNNRDFEILSENMS
jgi:phosphoglucomutase